MSVNLLGAGHIVRGYDPVPAAASVAAEKGATMFDSATAAVADADVVITMLPKPRKAIVKSSLISDLRQPF